MSAQTRNQVIHTNGFVGTTAVVALATSTFNTTNFFMIINNAASGGNSLAYTLDGSTPTINGSGITLQPGGSSTWDAFVPVGGVITVIGSAANTPYCITTG